MVTFMISLPTNFIRYQFNCIIKIPSDAKNDLIIHYVKQKPVEKIMVCYIATLACPIIVLDVGITVVW